MSQNFEKSKTETNKAETTKKKETSGIEKIETQPKSKEDAKNAVRDTDELKKKVCQKYDSRGFQDYDECMAQAEICITTMKFGRVCLIRAAKVYAPGNPTLVRAWEKSNLNRAGNPELFADYLLERRRLSGRLSQRVQRRKKLSFLKLSASVFKYLNCKTCFTTLIIFGIIADKFVR